jgi:hypothetical protein
MDRAAEIRSAIAQTIDRVGLFHAYNDDHVATTDRARQVAASIFEVLDKEDYLNPGLATDKENRIIPAITQALGNYDSSPGAYRPGQWHEIGVRPEPPDSEAIADAVYNNLVYLGYISAPTG